MSAPSTDNIDAPYTSALLRYDTQLKKTTLLLITMRATLSYVTAAEKLPLQALIDATNILHDSARSELKAVLKVADLVIRAEHSKPNRLLKESTTRGAVDEDLAHLGRAMAVLSFKAGELEQVTKDLLEKWEADVGSVE